MRIDAHQHFWRLSRGDYGWLTPKCGEIYRNYDPADLKPILLRHRIDKTILVQAAPTVAETEFLLDIAAQHSFVAGVVGWADFAAGDAPAMIGRLAADPLLIGLRPMVQDIADDDWLLRPELAPAFGSLIDHDLVFDALVLPRHLPRLLVLLDRYPKLAVVIDHGAKPSIRDRRRDPWRNDMAALAARGSVTCKLSGLITQAAAAWTIDDLAPFVDHLLAVFGSDRLIWGSDWPVVNLAGGYDRWVEATLSLLHGLDERTRSAILGGNSERVYLARRGRRPSC